MPEHPAGPRPQTAHRTGAAPYWNDSKTPSISTNWGDAPTRAGGSKRRLDCPWDKLLDEIHVRVVCHSDSPHRGVSPQHDCYRYGFPRPLVSAQVHSAEIRRLGRVQTVD